MARVELAATSAGTVQNQWGQPVTTVSVTVADHTTHNPVTVYPNETAISGTSGTTSTDALGRVEGWVNDGQVLDITVQGQTLTVELPSSAVGALEAANNLSDLQSASAARTNLGLGSAATQPSSAFDAAGSASAAQAAAEAASVPLSELGAANGVATLNGSSQLTTSQIPSSVATGGQINSRLSFNAIATGVSIPGDGNVHQVVETGIPKLLSAESGSASVSNPLASSFVARARFQINGLTEPEPTEVLAEINFRKVSDNTVASNLGFWYLVFGGSGSIANLEMFVLEWPYAPYNNIPSSPFIEVGDGSTYNLSLDLMLNSGAGGISVTNGMIIVEAGNYYTPGTTQIGNSPAPGPIGTL